MENAPAFRRSAFFEARFAGQLKPDGRIRDMYESMGTWRRLARSVISYLPKLGLLSVPNQRPFGLSAVMRVQDEVEWIDPALKSLLGTVDEIVVLDHGSMDGTWEYLQSIQAQMGEMLVLERMPLEARLLDVSNRALELSRFNWILAWDGDFIANTIGPHRLAEIRPRLESLQKEKRYTIVFLQLINLVGDLFHVWWRIPLHREPYLRTYSPGLRYVQQANGNEAILVPKCYRIISWFDIRLFHVNVKSARRMLIRWFLDEWEREENRQSFSSIEKLVEKRVTEDWGFESVRAAERFLVNEFCKELVPYDPSRYGDYPPLLQEQLQNPKYRVINNAQGDPIARSDTVE